ncbi:Hsp20/alpha crystallin family protein [Candidatus Falkowbacteria bacterium]|nr:MAG: Hsp20/alpha crystallin family protein [Candidatus Falkowbacteria bacterium]
MRKIFKKLSGLSGKITNKAADNNEIDDFEEISEEEENEEYDAEEEEEIDEEEIDEEEIDEDEEEKEWLQNDFEEGQLSIDVYQTPDAIIVKSTIAGVKPEDIDISINNDMLTIRGRREMYEKIKDEHYLYRECYWGSFSRSIILPLEIEAEKIEAVLENGVLTVTLPKAKSAKEISIKVLEK